MKKKMYPVRSKGANSIHLVPYSEHSSYDELREYVRFLKPHKASSETAVCSKFTHQGTSGRRFIVSKRVELGSSFSRRSFRPSTSRGKTLTRIDGQCSSISEILWTRRRQKRTSWRHSIATAASNHLPLLQNCPSRMQEIHLTSPMLEGTVTSPLRWIRSVER